MRNNTVEEQTIVMIRQVKHAERVRCIDPMLSQRETRYTRIGPTAGRRVASLMNRWGPVNMRH